MTLPSAIARTVMEQSDMFWHPSLSRFPKNSRCCDFPLRLERDIEAVQAVHLNDYVYVGGASSKSYQDEYRLFVYSLGADNWNILDTGVSRFALTSYKSKLVLIGGRKRNPPSGGCSYNWIYTNKVLMLESDLELKDDVIHAMQANRASACALSYGDYLLVAGGDDESPETNSTVEVYNSESNGWSYVSPLPLTQCKVKSATLHSDGNLYLHLKGDREQNYMFYAPTAALIDQSLKREEENSSSTWQNLKSTDLDPELTFLPAHVCSNLTTHRDHLILIGTNNEHSSNYSFFVYSLDASRWVAVADLPSEKHLVKPLEPPKTIYNTHLVDISSKELLLLGELVCSYHCHVICRVSFQSK